MNGVSLYRDGLPFDPPLNSCAGCTNAEAEIRALLDHIASSFLDDPTKFLGFDFTKPEATTNRHELFQYWVQKFENESQSKSKLPMCPELKKRIVALVYKLFSERCGLKRKRESVYDVLMLLKRVAANPFDSMGGECEGWRDEVLRARKALFHTEEDIRQELPFLKKRRRQKFLCATSSSSSVLSRFWRNEPMRRSKRTLLKIANSDLPRKHIPIGPSFQADVPDWRGSPNNKELSEGTSPSNSSKWQGTKIWPIKRDDKKTSEEIIGKGRPAICDCTARGSSDCIRFHVNKARLQLQSDLGPAFYSLGIAEMGEEVSQSWTQEEQLRFDDLVRQNSSSEGRSFWEPVLKHFTSKSRQDIVRFYFNVFLLRWMSIRTRMGTCTVDSSDDENFG